MRTNKFILKGLSVGLILTLFLSGCGETAKSTVSSESNTIPVTTLLPETSAENASTYSENESLLTSELELAKSESGIQTQGIFAKQIIVGGGYFLKNLTAKYAEKVDPATFTHKLAARSVEKTKEYNESRYNDLVNWCNYYFKGYISLFGLDGTIGAWLAYLDGSEYVSLLYDTAQEKYYKVYYDHEYVINYATTNGSIDEDLRKNLATYFSRYSAHQLQQVVMFQSFFTPDRNILYLLYDLAMVAKDSDVNLTLNDYAEIIVATVDDMLNTKFKLELTDKEKKYMKGIQLIADFVDFGAGIFLNDSWDNSEIEYIKDPIGKIEAKIDELAEEDTFLSNTYETVKGLYDDIKEELETEWANFQNDMTVDESD